MADCAAMILHVFAAHPGSGDVREHDKTRAIGEIGADNDEVVVTHFLGGILQCLCERQEWIEIPQCFTLDAQSGELMPGDGIGKRCPVRADAIGIRLEGSSGVRAQTIHMNV